jgi:hypothetical protein
MLRRVSDRGVGAGGLWRVGPARRRGRRRELHPGAARGRAPLAGAARDRGAVPRCRERAAVVREQRHHWRGGAPPALGGGARRFWTGHRGPAGRLVWRGGAPGGNRGRNPAPASAAARDRDASPRTGQARARLRPHRSRPPGVRDDSPGRDLTEASPASAGAARAVHRGRGTRATPDAGHSARTAPPPTPARSSLLKRTRPQRSI